MKSADKIRANGGKMKRAIVSGSYDPFTFGHLDIVKQASAIFDEVHVVIFTNSNKKRNFSEKSMVKAIKKVIKNEGLDNCIVTSNDGLLAKYCEDNGINFTVRGLRNNMDYNYEENISEVNQLINPNLTSIYLRAGNKAISSSMVRELFSYHEDITPYVPKEVLKVMNKDMDYKESIEYLLNHEIFQGNFNDCLDIEIVMVNPKTHSIDDNEALNTKPEYWLECGPYKKDAQTHDIDLDCGGETMEEAIIELAKLVKKKYGKNALEKVRKQYG